MADYWSYNGYTLPRLPAGWDMQKYPYAVILGVKSAFGFNLVCHSELPTVRTVNGENVIGFNIGTKVQSFTFNRASDTDWVDKGEVTPTPSDSNVTWYYYDNDTTEFVWCNNDIKDESGNTAYSASVPVPIAPEEPEEPEEPETPAFDLTAWLTGYALGLCGKPLPFSTKKEPVAYLYNGVRLPKLPEWDRETYPYVYISTYGSGTRTAYKLSFCTSLYTSIDEDGDDWSLYAEGVLSSVTEIYPALIDATEWPQLDPYNNGKKFKVCNYDSDYVFWSDHSFLGPNGEEWIVASEPVPVYE